MLGEYCCGAIIDARVMSEKEEGHGPPVVGMSPPVTWMKDQWWAAAVLPLAWGCLGPAGSGGRAGAVAQLASSSRMRQG